jgi:hypothetical protein
MELGDALFAAGHKVDARTNVAEIINVDKACSNLDIGNHGLSMHLSGTPDSYNHSSRSILDFSQYCAGNVVLQAV